MAWRPSSNLGGTQLLNCLRLVDPAEGVRRTSGAAYGPLCYITAARLMKRKVQQATRQRNKVGPIFAWRNKCWKRIPSYFEDGQKRDRVTLQFFVLQQVKQREDGLLAAVTRRGSSGSY